MAPTDSSKAVAGTRQVLVSLVSMPFKDLRHPPIQLGILEQCLTRVGIATRSHSFELAFMEHLYSRTAEADEGPPLSVADYQRVACQDFVVNLGDWIFKVSPYAEPSPEDDEYLDYARSQISEEAVITAVRMKRFVPEFLTAAADELLAGEPHIVGFSTVFQQNVASLVLAKILKARDPSLTIVFGGGNCDGPMGAALHECFPWIDVVVRGEGERVFPEVVLDTLAGQQCVLSLGCVAASTGGQWSFRKRLNRKSRWTRFLPRPTRNFLSVLSAARCEQSCGPKWLSCLRVQGDVGGVPSPTAHFAD